MTHAVNPAVIWFRVQFTNNIAQRVLANRGRGHTLSLSRCALALKILFHVRRTLDRRREKSCRAFVSFQLDRVIKVEANES